MRRNVLITFGVIIAAIILFGPFVLHKLSFDTRFRSNRERWFEASNGNYDVVV
jgi:hypothetical protein